MIPFRHHGWLAFALFAATLILFARCASPPSAPDAANTSILVAGTPFDIGTRVVTWREPDGYSAYREGKHLDATAEPDHQRRYGERPGNPQTLDDVQQIVHQFVVHYDTCGTSRQCFKVLQDVRNLSVHFLLDVDGTIYQTLDVKERAWHATYANDFAVGVEIAHPGAFPQPMNAAMRPWYERDAEGWRLRFPKWMTETGVRTPGFVGRPARPEIVRGEVQGKVWYQFDFTPEQYRALPKLIAGLARALPRLRIEAPRDRQGQVVNHALPKDVIRSFDGIVGHFHVQPNKQDPGPAFQWERVLRAARAQ